MSFHNKSLIGIMVGLVLAGTAFFAFSSPARADDPSLLSFGAGWFDFNRKKDQGVELRFEYRSGYKIPYIQAKPFAAVGGATSGHGFLGGGILWDVYLGRRFVVTPSFAPHIYVGGNSKLDLSYAVEFRSQIEFAYRFDDRSRLGVAVSHYSNAGLGKDNPGVEILSLYYTIPVDKLF